MNLGSPSRRWKASVAVSSTALVIFVAWAWMRGGFLSDSNRHEEELTQTQSRSAIGSDRSVPADSATTSAESSYDTGAEDRAGKGNVVNTLEGIEPSYENIVTHFDHDDLPAFYDLLEDGSRSRIWYKGLLAIAFLGESPESSKVLRRFIERAGTFKDFRQVENVHDKALALEYLGLIGDELALDTLILASTREGAISLGARWIHDDIPFANSRGDFTVDLRFRAARGLVYTQDPDNIKVVEGMYDDAVRTARPIINRHDDVWEVLDNLPVEERGAVRLYGEMAYVMAIREVIDEIGLEAYKPAIYDLSALPASFRSHWKRYDILNLDWN